MITNTNRSFGEKNGLDLSLLTLISKGYPLLNGSMRLVWGILFDKIGFKPLYYTIAISEVI
jgi:hypothetical protein